MSNPNHLNKLCSLAVYLNDYLQSSDLSLERAKSQAGIENPFFTSREIDRMIESIRMNYLDEDKIRNWYHSFSVEFQSSETRIGIIGAGNIPYVSFHDIWCCLAAGFRIALKPSSKDRALIVNLVQKINEFLNHENHPIEIVETLTQFDAVITTGGHQASQVFKSYFEKYPSLIRGHRNSIAILSGNESEDDFFNLGKDVFSYYGLGCRNVHHLLVPAGYNFDKLLDRFDLNFIYVKECNKYCNNYDYYLASQLLSRSHFLQAESILLIESNKLNPPIACLCFSYYKDEDQLNEIITSWMGRLQCICSNINSLAFPVIPFGKSQYPELDSYQDNLDTISFLANL
ncbi:MAG: hypothetical protein IPK91_00785 [Saprospiraceae bacterium]|jgi:hypothetical protein|nr:hypothetical protein [Saprospiraceae bacterium]MBK8295833.1 hypothetical protein [Saprospiraceae bacterium]